MPGEGRAGSKPRVSSYPCPKTAQQELLQIPSALDPPQTVYIHGAIRSTEVGDSGLIHNGRTINFNHMKHPI